MKTEIKSYDPIYIQYMMVNVAAPNEANPVYSFQVATFRAQCRIFNQCGFIGLNDIYGDRKAPFSFWENLFKKELPDALTAKHASLWASAANYMFSVYLHVISREPIADIKPDTELTIWDFIVNHPGFKVIHKFKNNAHGSGSIMCQCVLHMYPDEVAL